jgi:hypothetical protein
LSQTKFQYANGARVTDDGRVYLELSLSDLGEPTIEKLHSLGLEVYATFQNSREVEGWLSIFNLRALGSLTEVRHIALPIGGVTRAYVAPPQVPPTAYEPPSMTIDDILAGKQQEAAVMASIPSNLQGKITYDSWFALMELEGFATGAFVAEPGKQPSNTPFSEMQFTYATGAQVTDDGKVLVQLTMQDISDQAVAKLVSAGLTVRSVSTTYHRVIGWYEILNLRALGDIPEVGKMALSRDAAIRTVLEGGSTAVAEMVPSKTWQNGSQPADVNNDGVVTPLDVNLTIIALNANGPRSLSAYTGETPNFIDVNGDDAISPLDALLIIQHLNSHRDTSGELMQFRVEATDENGDPIEEITVGQTFYLSVFARDNRSSPQGIFAAYADLDVDTDLATPVDEEQPLEHLGSVFAAEPTEHEEELVYRGQFTADAVGELDFSAAPSFGLGMELFLFGISSPLSLDHVAYSGGTLNIVGA